MTSNLLCFNSSKTEFLLLGLKPQLDKVQSPAGLSNGVSFLPLASARNLGFIFDSNLTLAEQISLLFLDLVSITFEIFDAIA